MCGTVQPSGGGTTAQPGLSAKIREQHPGATSLGLDWDVLSGEEEREEGGRTLHFSLSQKHFFR